MKAKTKLIIGIVLAVVILAVGLTVTLVVTGNLERDQQQVVRSASQIETAMSTDLGGKTIVLAEDITVEGDLEMSRLADLDLNGHTLTVTGTFSVESDSAAEIEIKSTDGDKAVSGGTIDAGSVDINVPKAHVEWSADVRLGSDGTFTVLTSGDSFIFTGRFLSSGTAAASEPTITALGGRVDISSQTADVDYKINIPSTASDVRVDSGVPSTSSVEVITSKSVTVSGTVAVTVSEGATGVAITADSGSSLTVTGSAASVNAPSSSVTVAENSTVGSITAGDVTNNGTVSGSITASGDVVNNGSVTGDVTAGGSVTGDGDIGGNVEAGDVTVVEIPSLTSSATYNGAEQTFTVAATDYYDAVTVTGTDADTYTGTLSLSDKVNTKWSDGTTADKTVTLTIAPKSVAVVWSNKSLTYTGSAQAPAATVDTGITGETLALTVTGGQTNAGTYTATASTTNGNYTLTNATTSFTIAPMEITVPTLTKTVAYNGAEQTFTIAATDYYAAVTVRGTNADVYTETLALRDKANTVWADGTTADKTVTLTITRGTIDVGTAEELTEALSDSGYSTIRLTADIEYTNLAAFNTAVQAANGSLTIDLNDNTLTLTANGTTITAQNGFELTIANGELIANNSTYTKACFSAETDSTITFEDLLVTSTGSVLLPRGDAAEINIIDSNIETTGVYVVGTNAATEDNYGVEINIDHSTLTTKADDGDSCVVMINVAGTLNIKDTDIIGQRQGVIVRAGTATLDNVYIEVDLKYTAGTAHDSNPSGWLSGNEVAYGALIVGNNTKSTYNADAIVKMTGGGITCTTSVSALKGHTNAIYAVRVGGSNNTTSVTLSGTKVSGQVVNYNNTATITGLPSGTTVITALVSSADEFENALAVNDSYIVLVDDINVGVSGSTNHSVIISGISVTIDFNGHTITNVGAQIAFYVTGSDTVVNLYDNGDGAGGIYGGSGGNNMALRVDAGATVNIYGGNYSVGPDASNLGNSCLECGSNAGNGNLNIYGGRFSTEAAYNGWYYVLNLVQTQGADGTITVYGGEFVNYNPVLGDDNLGGNFVADGYKVIERTDGTYEVVAEEAEVTGDDIAAIYYYNNGVASKAEVYAASGLTAAIGGGYSDIVLMNDITTADRLTISSAESDVDLTIDLGGYTLTSTESGGYVFLILGCDTSNAYTPYKYSIDLTIKNGEIITSVDQSYAVDIRSKSDNVKVSLSDLKMTAVWGGMYSNGIGSGAVVTAENCEFIGTGDASVGAYLPANNTYTFTDCSFSGDDGIYIKSGTYTFNNCTFAASGEYAEPEYNGNGAPSVGAAMAIDSCQGYQNPIVVTVNGGTFSSVNGYGIMEYITERTEGMEPYATVTLKGDITFGECGKGEIYSQNNLVAIEYEVSSVDDLVALNDYKSVMLNGAVMNVTLTQDIDLADGNFTTEDFTLIDEYAGYALIPHFRGVFNGGNHTIISGLSNLNAIIGIMYGESEIRDLTVKLTNPERITRVVAEYGCLYESNGEGSIIYTSDDSIEYKFTNVDYVTADNAYYNIGDSGNRALYYNDTNYAYYYNSATGKYSSIWVGNIRTSDDSPIPANIVLTGCDVTGNFMGGNHASGAAVFLAGQIGTAVDVTITDSSFTGNLVGDNIGIVFANSSGVLNVRLTDEDEDGNYVWDDGINLDIEVNGTISTWKKSTGDNGSGYIFGNNATEGPATDITLVGGEGKISTATDITLTVDDNSQFVVSGITEEMSSLTLQLQLGTLTCYESEGGIRVTEASDYVVLLSLPSESVSGGSLATDIYRMYPRTLEQAIADGIVSDSEDIEWQTSADGKQYTIVADGDSRYIVVNANANASYYYAFEESATGVLSRATLYAYSDSGIPLASVSYR